MLLAAGLVGHATRYHSSNQAQRNSEAHQTDRSVDASVPYLISDETDANARKERREEADLAAQTRMAAAAEKTFYVGFASLVLLFATVVFAGLAWHAAAKGADAAWKTEETSREIGQKQSMAYVFSSRAEYKMQDPEAKTLLSRDADFYIYVKNIGQTVAKDVELGISWEGVTPERFFSAPNFNIAQPRTPVRNIAPNEEVQVFVNSGAIELFNALVASGKLEQTVRIWGTIWYRTVYKKRFKSQFAFYILPVEYDHKKSPLPMFSPPAIRLEAFEEVADNTCS